MIPCDVTMSALWYKYCENRIATVPISCQDAGAQINELENTDSCQAATLKVLLSKDKNTSLLETTCIFLDTSNMDSTEVWCALTMMHKVGPFI